MALMLSHNFGVVYTFVSARSNRFCVERMTNGLLMVPTGRHNYRALYVVLVNCTVRVCSTVKSSTQLEVPKDIGASVVCCIHWLEAGRKCTEQSDSRGQ